MSTLLAEDSYDITMHSIVRYAGASGDFTPIHYDPDTLAEAGYDRFFAMGMLTVGRLGALVGTTFGEESIRRLRVRMRERAWVGSHVTLRIMSAHVTDTVADEPGRLTVRVEASIDGRVIADGEAVVDHTPAQDKDVA